MKHKPTAQQRAMQKIAQHSVRRDLIDEALHGAGYGVYEGVLLNGARHRRLIRPAHAGR